MSESEKHSNLFLLSELKKGQESAFDYIFKKYYKALCAQAMPYLNDLDSAQNQVQECFIKLWEKRQDADSIKNLSSYLSFMVRNQCIDYLRKTKAMDKAHQRDSLLKENEGSADESILSFEFEEKLVVALSNLPERCRIAFEYSRFENLTYTEIAKKMKISNKAVEALISRSLKTLRVELKDYLPLLILLLKISV